MTGHVKRLKLGAERGIGTLGTFPGVFTPSILTILGIILFLRLGFVVGNAGLERALIIIGLANVISVLTSVSLAAIATNLNVKVGGHYYLISRTIGAEFGGALGIVLFLAMSASVGFYCTGLSEAVVAMLPPGTHVPPQCIAALAVAFLFTFAWLGADWSMRLQYLVMSMLGMALVSFFAGGLPRLDGALLARNWDAPVDGLPFWTIFAIFFPAVTGFTQGVSMSGDLKDPSRSLPLGTFAAVGISIVIYFAVAIVFASVMPGEDLSREYEVMKRVARIEWLIDTGVIAATLSSAMASLLGAPRMLQSLASDRIFPLLVPFARGAGPTNNPRRGVLFSGGIGLATISLGNLNVIAPVVSMFFLISYGLLNYATFYEARAASPSFRPTFRWFDARISLLGALGCLAVMAAVHLVASIIAVLTLFGIYQHLRRTAGPARWADSKHSYHFQLMREHLFAIPSELEHPRDWRPQLLAFSDDSHRRRRLLRFASWIEGDSGLTTAIRILEGRGTRMHQRRIEAEEELRADIAQQGVHAFARVVAVPDFRIGAQTVTQSFGIGPIRANTILLNGPEQVMPPGRSKGKRQYGRYLSQAIRLGCNIIILSADEDAWSNMERLPSHARCIDVWWWGDASSRLMLLLAYLMTRSQDWSDAKIRVLAPSRKKGAKKSLAHLNETLEAVRIKAKPEVVLRTSMDTVAKRSRDASCVFVPLRFRKNRPMGPFGTHLRTIFSRLPLVALVIAADDIDLEAEPEEGKPGEVAAAMDAAEDAKKRAEQATTEAAKAAALAEEHLSRLQAAIEREADRNDLSEIRAAANNATKIAQHAARNAEKAWAEADKAARQVEALLGRPP